MDGTILPQPQGLTADVTVDGRGIDATRLQPYLVAAGVEPALRDGSLKLRAVASVANGTGGIAGDLAVSDFRYADGVAELIKLGALRVGGLALTPDGVSVASINSALYDAFGQRQVSTIYSDINQYKVVVTADPGQSATPGSLERLYVQSSSGAMVPITALTRMRDGLATLVATCPGHGRAADCPILRALGEEQHDES